MPAPAIYFLPIVQKITHASLIRYGNSNSSVTASAALSGAAHETGSDAGAGLGVGRAISSLTGN